MSDEAKRNIFFTADEHYGHKNVIKYCNRPFKNIEEMNEVIITNHNSVVKNSDTVYHIGDFTLGSKSYAESIIRRLNGMHIFIRGSHDRWNNENPIFLQVVEIEGIPITLCHYAMRVWDRSHYNSWQLYGHSHGQLSPTGKQWDVGVDNSNFFPMSFNAIKIVMEQQPDNFNLVGKLR